MVQLCIFWVFVNGITKRGFITKQDATHLLFKLSTCTGILFLHNQVLLCTSKFKAAYLFGN